MKLVKKWFEELSAEELFEIYKLRVAVFVVEQACPYQEVDDADKDAYHVFLRDEDGIQAYLRVLPKGATMEEVAIGRVIASKRGCGMGRKIMQEGIDTAQTVFGAEIIAIEAQSYAKGFYEKLGFVQVSEEFLEDGIPHIKMIRRS